MTTILKFIKDMEKKTEINVIQTDKGSEFNNSEFKKFCEENNIILDLFKSDSHKLGIINRWHRTIKEKLVKYFDSFDTVRWIDIIDKIVYNYNHTKNRGIGYKPVEVNDFIENMIRQKKKIEGENIRENETEFKVGQYVRELNDKNIFDDKMKSKYSNEIYEITKVNNNSLIIKNDKNDLFKIKKDEVKIVKKPVDHNNNIQLKERIIANKEHKQERILRREGIDQQNIIIGKRNR